MTRDAIDYSDRINIIAPIVAVCLALLALFYWITQQKER
jgi:hypothetical protein